VPEGQRKLTADSGFQRIIFVAQNPGHVFPALSEAVQQVNVNVTNGYRLACEAALTVVPIL